MPRQALLCVAILSATACAAEAGAAGHQLPTTGWTPSPGSPALLRLRGGGYSLGLRDSIMIAHSFKGAEFGPAQNMHGATYTVDVEFHVDDLEKRLNWVLDIGEGMAALKTVLVQYNFKNLDELFPEENTTTEFMCRKIFDGLAEHFKGKIKGDLTVKLWESHNAWASYRGNLS